MSEQSNETKTIDNVLTVGNILNNAFSIALNNAASIILISIVYIFTIWVPYINIGTTIGFYAFVIAIARNEKFSVDELFSSKYRKRMGTILLLWGICFLGMMAGFVFLIIPGIIISIAWGQANYLVADKNLDAMEALKTSYKITYGEKGVIFLSALLVSLILWLAKFCIASIVATTGSSVLALLAGVLTIVVSMTVWIGFGGYVYNELSKKIN